MRARRLAAVLLAVCCATQAVGCGISTTGPISLGSPPRARVAAEQVYFVRDGRLHPVGRTSVVALPARSQVATSPRPTGRVEGLDLLAAGPLPPERDAGFTTELPPDIRLFPAEQSGGDLTVLLIDGGQLFDPDQLSDLAVAQIACTAAAGTQRSDPVQRVTLYDKASDHTRGPTSCPVPLSGRPG